MSRTGKFIRDVCHCVINFQLIIVTFYDILVETPYYNNTSVRENFTGNQFCFPKSNLT